MATRAATETPTSGGHPPGLDDELAGRLGWLQGQHRIATVLPTFAAGEARFQCDGMRVSLIVEAHPVYARLDGDVTPREFLAVRPVQGEALVTPWVVGGTAVLWVDDDHGLLAFRVPCTGSADGALLVAMPEVALRYSRRGEMRFVPTPGGEHVVGVTLQSGPRWVPCTLLNLSASGLQIETPVEVALAAGTPLRLKLQVGAPHAIALTAEVRHRDALDDGRLRLGLQFREINSLDQLCLERFLSRTAPAAPVERQATNALPRALVDVLRSPEAETPFRAPAPERLPSVVLMQARTRTLPPGANGSGGTPERNRT